MISGNPNEWRGETFATADSITDVVNNISESFQMHDKKFEGVYPNQHVVSRIADDLDETYQGWWGENRYSIEIIVRKM